MDNFKIDITAKGEASLLKAIEIAFAHNGGGKVESYQVITVESSDYNGLPKELNGKTALVMRWTKDDKLTVNGPVALPFKLDAAGAADFANRWLNEQDFGREPDMDGSVKKGWRLFTGAWGHVCGDQYSVFAVAPAWAMYGK